MAPLTLFRGMVCVGGFMTSNALPKDPRQDGAMTLVWGRNGYFGYGPATSSPSDPDRHMPSKALPSGDLA
jgi:hypothetical protein